MDIIIPNLKRYSDGEIDRAFMKEIQNGFNLREARQKKQRVAQAAKEAQAPKGDYAPYTWQTSCNYSRKRIFPTNTEVRSRDCAF
jgi:hypothetical protein